MNATEELQQRLGALPESTREHMAAQVLDLWETLQRKLRAGESIDPKTLPELETVPYERIAHLSGVFKGGPTDLAGNKRYLEGMGESSMHL